LTPGRRLKNQFEKNHILVKGKVAAGFINLTGKLPFSEDVLIIAFFPDHEVLGKFRIKLFQMYISIPWLWWIGPPEGGLPKIDAKVAKLHLRNFLENLVTHPFHP